MDDLSGKRSTKRKPQVSQQGIIYDVNPHKYIKKDSDDETLKMSPHKRQKTLNIEGESKNSIPDPESHAIRYFKKILQTLKNIPEESKDIFVSNALEEYQGQEIELSCYHSTRHCIETLLSFCTDTSRWRQFMTSFSTDKETVCTDPSASHVVELLIEFALKNLKNWSSVIETNGEEKPFISFSLLWIVELGNFVLENFTNCLGDPYAAHVATSIIRALGGDMSESSGGMSKKLNKKKITLTNSDEADDAPSSEDIILESIPKEFKEKLKLFSKCVRKIENISDFVSENYGALVIEALIYILSKRMPKKCKKLIRKLAENLFAVKDNYGVPVAFLQKNSSFVIEKMFESADEDLQTELWNQYIDESLEHLISHQISNLIVQRFFDSVKSSTLLQVMSEKTGSLFNKILEAERLGIFLSVASACNRLKAHQALFMKNIMQCLQCSEPPERQLKMVPLLLGLDKYDDSEYVKTSQLTILLQGSLLVQNLLTFQKPIKLVNSLLDMKPQSLTTLACHFQGCHVLTAFFRSETIGEKSKDKFVQSLQGIATPIACDENGNITLSRIWVLLSLKQKGVIANALARDEDKLKSIKRGNIIFNKFKIFQYKRNFEQWKEFQVKFLNKR